MLCVFIGKRCWGIKSIMKIKGITFAKDKRLEFVKFKI